MTTGVNKTTRNRLAVLAAGLASRLLPAVVAAVAVAWSATAAPPPDGTSNTFFVQQILVDRPSAESTRVGFEVHGFINTDDPRLVRLVEAVGLVQPRTFQIIVAGSDRERLQATLRQGREIRKGLPVSLEGCGGALPDRWDPRAAFADAGAGPDGTATVEIRVRALEVPSCLLVTRIAVPEVATPGSGHDVLISDVVSFAIPRGSGRGAVIWIKLQGVRGFPATLAAGERRGRTKVTLEVGERAFRSTAGADVLTRIEDSAREGGPIPEILLRTAGGDTVVLEGVRVLGVERGATTVISLQSHQMTIVQDL